MNTSTVAITLPNELLELAERAVERGRAPSLESYIAMAIEEKTERDDVREDATSDEEMNAILDAKLARSGGPMTEDEIRRIDGILDGFERRRKERAERRT